MWRRCRASDVPLEQRELVEYFTTAHRDAQARDLRRLRRATRPPSVASARCWRAISSASASGRASRRSSPRPRRCRSTGPRSTSTSPSPAHGVPVKVYSMAIAGATSPVTLAGSVVQGVAEFLGVATALQVAAPGASSSSASARASSTCCQTTFSMGCLESALMGAMATEVGHYLGVPTLNPGHVHRRKHPGLQAGYEKALKVSDRVQREPRHRHRLGTDRLAQHHVPAAVGGRQRDGRHGAPPLGEVEVSDGHAGRRSPSPQVGPGGGFLGEKETAQRIRAGEHYLPTVSNRLSYEKWVEEGRTENDVATPRSSGCSRPTPQQPCLDDGQHRRARRDLRRGPRACGARAAR